MKHSTRVGLRIGVVLAGFTACLALGMFMADPSRVAPCLARWGLCLVVAGLALVCVWGFCGLVVATLGAYVAFEDEEPHKDATLLRRPPRRRLRG